MRRDVEFIGYPRINKRENQQPDIYQALVAYVVEPPSYQEAAQHQVLVYSMVDEYISIMNNDVWEVVLRPLYRSVVGS